MLSTLAEGPPGPHVVVVGNHKGGSGKSTVAMHVIVALLRAGMRVAVFDLDLQQQSLTHYIQNRREWARRKGVPLELPTLVVSNEDASYSNRETLTLFTNAFASVERDHDFIVIDTPSGEHRLSLLAHGMADTLVTPINDSFVDLDVIASISPSTDAAPKLSRYGRNVGAAIEGRRRVFGRSTDWVVLRNRLAPKPSRNQWQIAEVLSDLAPRIGFRTAPGLSERVVYREYFPYGLTAFDAACLGANPGMAHMLARVEVDTLIEELGLLLPVDDLDQAIEFVNDRDRPLALYVFSRRTDAARDVIARTSSGGACVNATMFHVAVPALPFGGVGPSGMGAYHGRASFDTFSHAKSVLTRSTRVDPKLGYPPYTSRKDRIIRRFL